MEIFNTVLKICQTDLKKKYPTSEFSFKKEISKGSKGASTKRLICFGVKSTVTPE